MWCEEIRTSVVLIFKSICSIRHRRCRLSTDDEAQGLRSLRAAKRKHSKRLTTSFYSRRDMREKKIQLFERRDCYGSQRARRKGRIARLVGTSRHWRSSGVLTLPKFGAEPQRAGMRSSLQGKRASLRESYTSQQSSSRKPRRSDGYCRIRDPIHKRT